MTILRNLFCLIFALASVQGFSQSFLSRYPKLKESNLNQFFEDWKSYSDNISTKYEVKDSVLDIIMQDVIDSITKEGESYLVVPETIEVRTWDMSYNDFEDWEKEIYERMGICSIDFDTDKEFQSSEVMYRLPDNGLYLTDKIYEELAKFAGGLRVKKWFSRRRYSKKNTGNISALKRYIPVDYGHWGGYWHFLSFPAITMILRCNDLIVVLLRDSWCSGYELWYIKQGDRFVKSDIKRGWWIE